MSGSSTARTRVTVTAESGQSVEAARVYSVSQLNQHTAQVLEEINQSKRPAVVTRHGRFVALITPLAGVGVESVVLSRGPLADELYSRVGGGSPSRNLSADEVEAEIDLWS
jgi:antitoxin (DNA-binding transcriptional repressor) of toxin-antitoxin stability system